MLAPAPELLEFEAPPLLLPEPSAPVPPAAAAPSGFPRPAAGRGAAAAVSLGAEPGTKARAATKSKGPEWTPWKDRVTKNGHRDTVLFIDVLHGVGGPSGTTRTLLSAAADGSVRVFDLNSVGSQPAVRERLQLQPPAAQGPGSRGSFCTCFAFSGRWTASAASTAEHDQEEGAGDLGSPPLVFAGYETGRVLGWEVSGSDLRPAADLQGHQKAVTALRHSPGLLGGDSSASSASVVSSSLDGTIRVWALPPAGPPGAPPGGQCLFALEFGPRNPVADFVLLPGAAMAVACSWDGVLRSLDLRERRCVGMAQASSAGLRAVCVSAPAGANEPALLFAGGEDCHISGYAYSRGGEITQLCSWKAHNANITSLRLYNQGQWLVSTSEDRTVKIWMPTKGTLVDEFRGHAGAVVALAVADRDRLIWTGARDWTIRSWDLAEVEHRVWERDQMTKMDTQSWAEELAQRAAARAANKSKKKNRGGASSKSPRKPSPRKR